MKDYCGNPERKSMLETARIEQKNTFRILMENLLYKQYLKDRKTDLKRI